MATGGDKKTPNGVVTGSVAADPSAIHKVLEAAGSFADQAGLTRRDQVRLRIIIEELLTNILKHGQLSSVDGRIDYSLEVFEGYAAIRISDAGIPFNPSQDLPLEPTRAGNGEGGQGWPLILTWCAVADCRNVQGRNQLYLRLPLESRD